MRSPFGCSIFGSIFGGGGNTASPPIITATTSPTLSPLSDSETPADGYTAGTYISSAGAVVSDVPTYLVNGNPEAANYDLQTNDVLRVDILVTDDASNTRTFSVGPITVSDGVAPSLLSVVPLDGATDVAVDAIFAMTFSENIILGTGLVVLRTGAGAAVESFNVATGLGDGGGTVAVAGAVITFTPGSDLSEGEAYNIPDFPATAAGDTAGNFFAGWTADPTFWNWTMVSGVIHPIDQIPGLVGWFDADLASSIQDTGGAVSLWSGRSQAANSASQAIVSERPVTGTRTINGMNAIDFQPGSQHSLVIADPPPRANGYTVFAVVRFDNLGSNRAFLGEGTGCMQLRASNAGALQVVLNGTGAILSTANGVVTTGTNYLVAFQSSAAGNAIYLGGGPALASNLVDPGYTADPTRIGMSGGANRMDGLVAELPIYSGILSNTDMDVVGNYLATKWGLSWVDLDIPTADLSVLSVATQETDGDVPLTYTIDIDSVVNFVLSTSATQPTAAQIVAGQESSGAAAPESFSETLTIAGSPINAAITSTSLNANFHVHAVAAGGSDADVITASGGPIFIDTTPLAALTRSPADDATGVAANAALVLDLIDDAAPAGSMEVYDVTGAVLIETFNLPTGDGDNGGSIALSANAGTTDRVTIILGADMVGLNEYSVRNSNMTDTNGNPMADVNDNTTWNFTTAAVVAVAPSIAGLVAISHSGSNNPSTDIVLAPPPNIIAGEPIVAVVHNDSITAGIEFSDNHATWKLLDTGGAAPPNVRVAVYWKIATAADIDAALTIVAATSSDNGGFFFRLKDAHPTDPIEALLFGISAAGISATAQEITTLGPNRLVIGGAVFDGGDGPEFLVSGPGWAKLAEFTTDLATSWQVSGVIASKEQAIAGPTGDVTFTSPLSDGWAQYQFAVRGA